MFLRKTTVGREPLPVAMTSVRMGERVLQVGLDDPRIAGTLAAKAGISGHAAIVVTDERSGERARAGAAKSAALIDVHVAPLQVLPFESASFDVVVIHNIHGLLATLTDPAAALRECHRVLRHGGRAIVIESGRRTGLGALLRAAPRNDTAGATTGALNAAGFISVRVLADREGYRFVEGLKT